MADEKLVLKGGYYEIGGVDRTAYVRSATLTPGKPAVDVSALGDKGDRTAKGPSKTTIALELMHADDGAFQLAMLQLVETDTMTAFKFRQKDGAKAVGNQEWTGNMNVNSLPSGGTRGEAVSSSVTYDVDGQVTIDDGVTTVTI